MAFAGTEMGRSIFNNINIKCPPNNQKLYEPPVLLTLYSQFHFIGNSKNLGGGKCEPITSTVRGLHCKNCQLCQSVWYISPESFLVLRCHNRASISKAGCNWYIVSSIDKLCLPNWSINGVVPLESDVVPLSYKCWVWRLQRTKSCYCRFWNTLF